MQIGGIIKRSFKMKGFIFGLVALLSSISFGYSDNVATLLQTTEFTTKTFTKNTWNYIYQLPGSDSYSVCFTFRNYNGSLRVGVGQNPSSEPGTNFIYWSDWAGNYVCLNKGSVDRYIMVMPLDSTTSVGGDFFNLNGLLNTELPLMSSLECQSEYSLIPISSIDQNYCSSNGFCPSYYVHLNEGSLESESALITSDVNLFTSSGIVVNSVESPLNYYFDVSPNLSGGSCDLGSGNWSALYINGIQHESASLIDINIADYVPWDYSINDDVFDLDIGSGYDQDYIDGVIDVQSYRPTSEDFTQTFVGGLILFTPYIVILLFVILVWNLIKKIFKTK